MSKGSIDESEMLHAMLTGDRKVLHDFYQEYAVKLSRYIHARVHTPQDSEEILQDTLFAFLEAIRDFHGKSSINTFLFSICQHKIIDYYRRKKLKHLVFSQVPRLEALVSPLLNPEEELDETILREKINNVLSRLLPRYRHVLLLKYVENLSVERIAQKLAISFKSAESRLFRARKAFVEAFVAL